MSDFEVFLDIGDPDSLPKSEGRSWGCNPLVLLLMVLDKLGIQFPIDDPNNSELL